MSDVDPTDGGIHSGDPTSGSSLPGADQLRGWGLQWIESLIGQVVKAIVGVLLPGSAFGQLQNWAQNLLPAQILAPLQSLVGLLVTVLDSIPFIGPPLGNAVQDLANLFGLMNTNTDSAQDTGNVALSQIQQIKAALDAGTTGALITDSFDRAADSSANGLGTNWDQSYDSGSGTLGVDGNGAQHWFAVGTGSRTCKCRYQALPTNTNTQKISAVLNSPLQNNTVNPEYSLCGRMNTAKTDFIKGFIDCNSCEIGYTIGGTYTRLGAAVSIVSNAGDLWELYLGTNNGTTGDDYEFVLYQNGVERVRRTDSRHASAMNSSHRFTGQVVKAGAKVVGFVTQQSRPPDVAVFTATDYVPA
jgi:hypothetical protein